MLREPRTRAVLSRRCAAKQSIRQVVALLSQTLGYSNMDRRTYDRMFHARSIDSMTFLHRRPKRWYNRLPRRRYDRPTGNDPSSWRMKGRIKWRRTLRLTRDVQLSSGRVIYSNTRSLTCPTVATDTSSRVEYKPWQQFSRSWGPALAAPWPPYQNHIESHVRIPAPVVLQIGS